MHYRTFQDLIVNELSTHYNSILIFGAGNWEPKSYSEYIETLCSHIYISRRFGCETSVLIAKEKIEDYAKYVKERFDCIFLPRVLEHLDIFNDEIFKSLAKLSDTLIAVVPDMLDAIDIAEKSLAECSTIPMKYHFASYQVVPEFNDDDDRHKWFTDVETIKYIPYFEVQHISKFELHGFPHLLVRYKRNDDKLPLSDDPSSVTGSLYKEPIRNLDWKLYEISENATKVEFIEPDFIQTFKRIKNPIRRIRVSHLLFKEAQCLTSKNMLERYLTQEGLFKIVDESSTNDTIVYTRIKAELA